jgi:hypothetical protein
VHDALLGAREPLAELLQRHWDTAVFLASRQPLSVGSHTFGLRWRIPERRFGASLFLIFT